MTGILAGVGLFVVLGLLRVLIDLKAVLRKLLEKSAGPG